MFLFSIFLVIVFICFNLVKIIQRYVHLFCINNKKFKQLPRKSLICETISKQIAGVNKSQKLNNPLGEQAKTLFLHRKPQRNNHFWTCQFKSVHYVL